MDKKKILVVDDEANIQKMLRTLLEINDYEVETVSDGSEAITRVKQAPPDLVLLDLVMPKVDGFKVLENLKQDSKTKEIPIILFTAAPPEVAAQRGASAVEAVDYVLKPFDRVTLSFLLQRIKELTDKQGGTSLHP
ncbi:MAG: response regulator [Chlamydiae bacterium]|nr:response regulator [Chlamydiota bacterium]MBI3276494.1 response regulator [Chlamydiota bacterium]